MGLRISVIVPVFNRQELLGRALRSIERQTAAVHQVIVVDDGSTDATADVVRNQFPNFELLQQPNRGVSSARNAGVQAATGDWVALLDSDDEWLPQKSNIKLGPCCKLPKCVCVTPMKFGFATACA